MNIKKYILIITLLTLAITITACNEENTQDSNDVQPQECNLELGETYCPSLGECVQVWIEKCPEYEEYYKEPQACTMEYMPVKGEITFPCEEGECTTILEFGNRCVAETQGATNIEPMLSEEPFVGETDEYGCIPSAGYTWCPSIQECIRVWETPCQEYEQYYIEPQACTKEYAPVKGEMIIPTQEGEKVITLKFDNPCMAEVAGAINIESINDIGEVITITPDENMPENKYDACEYLEGTPLEEHKECEYISQEICQFLGGEYHSCESACRHDPDAEACITLCVPVCRFN